MAMFKLGYPGPVGTFWHTAAIVYAGRRNMEPVACNTIKDIFKQIQSQKITHGLVPVENAPGSLTGVAYDLLLDTPGVYVQDEMLLPVQHHLLYHPGDVARFLVLGCQDQALGQGCITLLAAAIKSKTASLHHLLGVLSEHDIQIIGINYPLVADHGREKVLFIQVQGSRKDPPVAKALKESMPYINWLRVLGSYPACDISQRLECAAPASGDNLSDLRQGIDWVDAEIMRLLSWRRRLVDKVAGLKKDPHVVVDHKREKQIMARVRARAREENLSADVVEQIYRLILQESVARQKQLLQK